MPLLLSDARLTAIARWLVILCPLTLITGVMGNELPVSIIAALFLIHSVAERDWNWTRQSWVRLLGILWGWMLLRSTFAEFPMPALAVSLPWIRFPLFAAACAYWVLPDPLTQRRLLFSMLIGVCFLVGDALWQHQFGHDIFGHPTFDGGHYQRLTGPFNKPRVGIITTWFIIPVLALLSTLRLNRAQTALTCIVPIFAITMIYLSGERMAFLLTLMGCFLLVMLVPRIRLISLALAAIAAGLIVYMNMLHPEIRARQVEASKQQIGGFLQSPYGQLWLSAMRMVKEHPIEGVGPRNFRYKCPRPEYGPMDEQTLLFRCGNHTHNMYSEWLTETGLIGLGLFLATIGAWLAHCWKSRRALLRDTFAIGLFIAVFIRFWPLMAIQSQLVAWVAMPLWLMVGFLLARLRTIGQPQTNTQYPSP